MKISYGSTRIVFLCGNIAIKIGRFRCFRIIVWIIFSLFSNKYREQFFRRYGNSFMEATETYLMTGLNSNLVELEYYRSSPWDERVMPMINSYFGGWVTTQEQGEKITTDELVIGHPFASKNEAALFPEMNKTVQFCRRKKNGKIVLIDYGDFMTCRLLKSTLRVST